jgi:glycine/D-amino acid oxidase-like deaminating enzyme
VSPARDELRQAGIDGARVTGALYYPADGMVDPRDVTRALAAALNRRGVRLREQSRVLGAQPSANGVELELAHGSFSAGTAVLAAGAWSGGLAPAIPESVPVRGHLIGWRMPPGSIEPIVRHHHTYILQRANGFTIAGTSEERVGFDRTLDPSTVNDIAERARALLPMLPARDPDEAWLGFRPGTLSGELAIGRHGNTRLWLAYGHYRNGILMAPATARRITDEITSS